MKKQFIEMSTMRQALEDSDFFDEAILIEETSSSNDFAKRTIDENHGFRSAIIVVNKQTKGRGRQNKTWVSEFGSCLTFSLVFDCKDFFLSEFTSLICAKALHRALMKEEKIRKSGNLKIKWPNDLYAGEKKIAGILVENIYEKKTLSKQVVGIGLNFGALQFEGENLKNAGSVESVYGFVPNLQELFLKIISSFNECFKERVFDDAYINEHSYLNGRQVLIKHGTSSMKAEVINVTYSGELLVKNEEGDYKKIVSGSIEAI